MAWMEFLIGNLSFAYVFHEIQPAKVVDKAISMFLNVVTPGKGNGESNWMMKGMRSLEQHAERTSREIDIRNDLRRWDNEFPWMHHELIIRYLAGAAASSFALLLYKELKGNDKPSRSGRY